jgi:hypothetical protein
MPSSLEAIVDHFLVEARRVLGPRDPLLGDRKRDGAVAQQAGADIMVVGVQAEDISVFFGHGYSLRRGGLTLKKWKSCRDQVAGVALP